MKFFKFIKKRFIEPSTMLALAVGAQVLQSKIGADLTAPIVDGVTMLFVTLGIITPDTGRETLTD